MGKTPEWVKMLQIKIPEWVYKCGADTSNWMKYKGQLCLHCRFGKRLLEFADEEILSKINEAYGLLELLNSGTVIIDLVMHDKIEICAILTPHKIIRFYEVYDIKPFIIDSNIVAHELRVVEHYD
jgi:hypothetical protein